MLTLMLLRHAKSSWAHAGLTDFDRPLAPRGQAAAPAIGDFIAAQKLVPDAIICSSARRTRETLDLVQKRFGADARPAVAYEDELYLASAEEMLDRVRRADAKWKRLMIVGHNPGTHELAEALIGNGADKAVDSLTEKFPTAALAVLDFGVTTWADIRPRAGTLRHFVTPKMLA